MSEVADFGTPGPADDAPAPEAIASTQSIDAFCDALWLEQGLARNTLDAYRREKNQFSLDGFPTGILEMDAEAHV